MKRNMIISVAAGLFVAALSLSPAYAGTVNRVSSKCITDLKQNKPQKVNANTPSNTETGSHRVPEPGSLMLLALGAGALVLSRFNRKEKA